MLTELHIENLGVIARVDLMLGPGLTAITGETGAGKTMLVEALELVVGGRADPVIVRHGTAEARVDARFVDGDREIVLTRVVPATGRSRAYVDGRPATAAALADLAGPLVDLHGQHAHQHLLTAASQRQALDAFGSVDRQPLSAARAAVTALDAELAALGGDARARARELDVARFQLAELDAAALSDPDEDTALEAEEDTLAGAVEHKRAGGSAHEALAADGGARDVVATAAVALAGRPVYRDAAGRLDAVIAELDDVIAELRDTAETIDEDPTRLEAVGARRRLLHDLCRKYGDELADVIAYHRAVATRVDELEGFDARAGVLDAARSDALATAAAAAAAVRRARQVAAGPFAAAITQRLGALAMPDAALEVGVGDEGPGDDVEFRLAANPGAPALPLAKVASGGELARTMLALRLVAIGSDARGDEPGGPSTLVFDEVDAGIGGAAATAVGEALAAVGRAHQVLVVTHLPQVAAAASTQISVVKHVAGGETTATATVIDGPRRVDEIARMLSGDRGGPAAKQHARALLTR